MAARSRHRRMLSCGNAIGGGNPNRNARSKSLEHRAGQRGRPGADRGCRPGGPRHRCRRLVRRRISRDLAGIRGRRAIWRRISTGQGTREERDRLLAEAEVILGGWPFPLDLRARAQAAEMVSPAPGRREQSAARRSVGQRCDGDDLARRRQHAGDGGIRDRRHPAFRQEPPPRGHRSRCRRLRPPRLSAAADRRARPPASSAPAASGSRSAGCAPRSACGSSAPGARPPAPDEPLPPGFSGIGGAGDLDRYAAGQRFRRDLLPMDAGDDASVQQRALRADEAGQRAGQCRARRDRRRGRAGRRARAGPAARRRARCL